MTTKKQTVKWPGPAHGATAPVVDGPKKGEMLTIQRALYPVFGNDAPIGVYFVDGRCYGYDHDRGGFVFVGTVTSKKARRAK
jgi:hypothetical protein